MDMIINLIVGAVGGNAGGLLKQATMGPVLNSIVGAIGGAGGAALLSGPLGSLLGGGQVGAAASAGVGGVVLTIVGGLIKNAMAKKEG